ncbi:MAG: hypothetical protein V2B13_09995 [Pseudomonadota bacterium]
MDPIKGMLIEELKNSIEMSESYAKALARIPRGSLIKKKIKGHDYYYVIYREGDKIKWVYKGSLSEGEIKKYQENKKSRAQYRQLMARVNRQIKFLRGAIGDRKSAAVMQPNHR